MSEGAGDPEHEAARRLYDLALDFAERALRSQADLIREFETLAAPSMAWVGAVLVDDDEDEHLVLQADGHFAGRAVDDDTDRWERIASPDDVADHYDPVDLFADVADAIAEMFPGLELEALKDAGMAGPDWRPPVKVDAGGRKGSADADAGRDIWADAPPERIQSPEGFVPERFESPERFEPRERFQAPEPVVPLQGAEGPRPIVVTMPDESAQDRATVVGEQASTNSEQIRVLEDLANAGAMTQEQLEAAKAKLGSTRSGGPG